MQILDEDNQNRESVSEYARGEIKSSTIWIFLVVINNFVLISFNVYNIFVQGFNIFLIVIVLVLLTMNITLLVSGLSFKNFTNTGNLTDLQDALEKQKLFWQFMVFFSIIAFFAFILLIIFLFKQSIAYLV